MPEQGCETRGRWTEVEDFYLLYLYVCQTPVQHKVMSKCSSLVKRHGAGEAREELERDWQESPNEERCASCSALATPLGCAPS